MSRSTAPPAQPEPYPGDLPAMGATSPAAQPAPYVGDVTGDDDFWAQPDPYPGDLPAESAATETSAAQDWASLVPASARGGRPPYRREYTDYLGKPMTGFVTFRREDGSSFDVHLQDGVVEVPLEQGTYRLVAQLEQSDGRFNYQVETIRVEAYW